MDITSTTTWTVSKDGLSIEFTLEDIRHLLDRLAWSGDLIVFDEASGRCGSCIDVSLNGNALQITLFKEENDDHENELPADSTVCI